MFVNQAFSSVNAKLLVIVLWQLIMHWAPGSSFGSTGDKCKPSMNARTFACMCILYHIIDIYRLRMYIDLSARSICDIMLFVMICYVLYSGMDEHHNHPQSCIQPTTKPWVVQWQYGPAFSQKLLGTSQPMVSKQWFEIPP